MAFGRSNSLSLNTSAVNNSFAAQQGQQNPQQSTSLFGGSLFGSSQAQPAAAAASTGLFGAAKPAQAQSTSLFGNTQPAAQSTGGGLFGGAAAQPTASTSLFGQQSQAPASTSLFGQPAQTQQPANSSLFGGSLFGGANQQKPSGGLFGQSTTNTAPANNASVAPQNVGQPSLLGASRYSLGQPAPYTGRLSMGQGNAAQASSTPATKLNWDNVRPTTRFDDLVDSAKAELEQVDKMVQAQEAFCKQIEAFLPVHNNNLNSLSPDIDLIKDKVDTAEQALVTDAQGVQAGKRLAEIDNTNVLRCERIGENLRLPSQYHYAPASAKYGARKANATDTILDGDYDTDLVGNYFTPMTLDMQKLIDTYTSNLTEIESHLQTIEGSAISQAQVLRQQRAGPQNANAAQQQLTDTLRDMEETILKSAAKVGTCRDGVTGLTLRRAKSNGWRA